MGNSHGQSCSVRLGRLQQHNCAPKVRPKTLPQWALLSTCPHTLICVCIFTHKEVFPDDLEQWLSKKLIEIESEFWFINQIILFAIQSARKPVCLCWIYDTNSLSGHFGIALYSCFLAFGCGVATHA